MTAKFLTEEEFEAAVKELKGKQFPVLSEGYVMLVDAMGGDRRIVEAARTTSDLKSKSEAQDVGLLRYLMRMRHTTPSEFPQITLKIKIPYDAWRQGVRHRTAKINEFSSRYSEVPDCNDVTDPEKWRLQSTANRQGSSGGHVTEFPAGCPALTAVRAVSPELITEPADKSGRSPGEYLSYREAELHKLQREVYDERLKFGVAKEQARKDLCLSNYTELYWHWDLHNLLHFLGLRMDKHAQLEIRQYANIIGYEIVAKLFPVTWEAFVDYRLDAMALSALDRLVITRLAARYFVKGPWSKDQFLDCQDESWQGLKECRERDESLEKLRLLGLVQKIPVP